ncbi:ERVV2 protein, partial [Formicarius rufipectus]|nr:ERVV2 protein [Formicarius rufipectus]
TTFHSVIRALIPSLGGCELQKAIVSISAGVEPTENHPTDAIGAPQEGGCGLSPEVLQNRMTLHFVLASQGAVCKVINPSCCSQIDQSGRINKDLT